MRSNMVGGYFGRVDEEAQKNTINEMHEKHTLSLNLYPYLTRSIVFLTSPVILLPRTQTSLHSMMAAISHVDEKWLQLQSHKNFFSLLPVRTAVHFSMRLYRVSKLITAVKTNTRSKK